MTKSASRGVLATVLMLVLNSVAFAQRALPDDMFAWAFIEGSRLGASSDAKAQHAVVDTLFAWLAPGRVIQDATTERLLAEMIGESLVQGVPASLCVFSVSEEAGDPAPHTLRPVRFGAVLSIRTGDKHRLFLDRIGELLPQVSGESERAQASLPGGIAATTYRRHEWVAWRSITWLESAGELNIGLGEGALLRWFSLAGAPDSRGPVQLHREAAHGAQGASEPIAELFVNVDLLRRAFPDRFDDDAGARLLAAFHLANARSFMLHVGRSAGAVGDNPLLLIDATWSARSEARTAIRRLGISEPGIARANATEGATAVLRPDWSAWAVGMLDAYGALLGEREAKEFDRTRRTWAMRRTPVLARLSESMGPGATASLDRAGSGVAVGAIIFRFPLKDTVKPDGVLRDFRALMDPFAERISPDERERTWWLRSKPPAPIRVVSWGIAESASRKELVVAIDLGMGNEWSWKAVPRVREQAK